MVFVLLLIHFFALSSYLLQNLEILRCFFQSLLMLIINKVQLVFEIEYYHLVSFEIFVLAFGIEFLDFKFME